jgi:hypothetical protein
LRGAGRGGDDELLLLLLLPAARSKTKQASKQDAATCRRACVRACVQQGVETQGEQALQARPLAFHPRRFEESDKVRVSEYLRGAAHNEGCVWVLAGGGGREGQCYR